MDETCRMEYIRQIFPVGIREFLAGQEWQRGLEEIRVRVGQPVEFWYDTGVRYLVLRGGTGIWMTERERREGAYPPCRAGMQEIMEMMSYISSYSLYAYREELRQGFLVIEGGHRVGLAGGAVMEKGRIAGVSPVTFLNIRVSHEVLGCAGGLVDQIRDRDSVRNTLIVSKPGAGKTTLLRDCVRQLATGAPGRAGLKVCVVDERSELAACHLGIPQNDLGERTDVLDGCGKAEGMQMLLRTMSPQVIAVDELGGAEDVAAVEQAMYAGCRVIGTIHAGSVEELGEKPGLGGWVKKRLFERYVLVERGTDGARRMTLYGPQMERIC